MTMLEKAARALSDHFGCEWETMRNEDRQLIKGYARAVLEAVRDELIGIECKPKAGPLIGASMITHILTEGQSNDPE